MSAIFERRSVRNFLPDPVEPEKIERILRAGFQAPSAHNRQPREYIVHTIKEDKIAISTMSPYSKIARSAAVVISVCADLKASETENTENHEDSWWQQDCAASIENMLLQIVEEGLAGCWLGWYPDSDRVRRYTGYFGLPGHIVPVGLIPLGYPAVKTDKVDRYNPDKVYYEKYGARGNVRPL
ncbi:MAG: nitroreductase family protein [Treponema sp.]|nr:nitroreductase family protein [Treponema sp.]